MRITLLETTIAASVLLLSTLGQAAPAGIVADPPSVEFTTTLREASSKPGSVETATGTLTVRLTPVGAFYRRMTFRLSASGLSGRITSAHIHLGRGPRGGVVATLCGRPSLVATCDLPVLGQIYVPNGSLTLMRTWGAYVDVHTGRHSEGGLRGRLIRASPVWQASDVASDTGAEWTTTEVVGTDARTPVAARIILTAPVGVVAVSVRAGCEREASGSGLWLPPGPVANWRLVSRGRPIVRRLPTSVPAATSCRWVVYALGGAGRLELRLETLHTVKP